jgi:hypothetical protein
MNANESAPEVGVKPEVADQFIGGEIHIIADAKTGAISINSPKNLIIALGILETAKVIMIKKQQDAMTAATRPSILRASPADVPKLVRPS